MATTQQIKRIAAYFRRSTEDQENSIERQRMSFETYLKNNSEYEESPEVFIEDGVSGDSSVDRPVLFEDISTNTIPDLSLSLFLLYPSQERKPRNLGEV